MTPRQQAEQAHTALPWDTGARMTRVEVLPDGVRTPMCIADCHPVHSPTTEAERVANAAFIVRACNSHYELLEALKDIRTRAARIREDKAVVGVEAFYIERAATAAIANATKDTP